MYMYRAECSCRCVDIAAVLAVAAVLMAGR